MSDDQLPPAPLVSEDAARHVRQLAAEVQHTHPEYAARLLASIEGLAAPPPTDPRSPAAREWDRRMGVEPRDPSSYHIDFLAAGIDPAVVPDGQRWAASLQLDPVLGAALVTDIARKREPLDPEKFAALMPPGMDYADAVKDVELLLTRTPLDGTFRPKVSDLSPYALGQLALWAKWLQRHAAGHPQRIR